MYVRCLKATRYGGRFFQSWSGVEGYPAGEGSAFIAEIPVRKEDYEIWLASRRSHFAILTAELENTILPFSEEELRCVTDGNIEKLRVLEHRHSIQHWNPTVTAYPTSFLQGIGAHSAEWIYVIDLDNEIFTVNSQGPYGKVYFNLWNIPRSRWTKGFRNFRFDLRFCPEGHQMIRAWTYQVDAEQRHRLASLCRDHDVRIVDSRQGLASMTDVLGLLLFDTMSPSLLQNFCMYDPTHYPGNRTFREVAYAVLSLAAGDLYLESRPVLDHLQKSPECLRHYQKVQDGASWRYIPHFGVDFAMTGQAPGSAPNGLTIYWFHNVLVILAADKTLAEEREVLLGEAIEFGCKSNGSNFLVLLYSIRYAVFAEVCVIEGVRTLRRTDKIPVFVPGSVFSAQNEDAGRIENNELLQMIERSAGFRALQNFFQVAGTRCWRLASDTLPLDIYTQVLQYVDPSTLNTCSYLSPGLNVLCSERGNLGRDIRLLELEEDASDNELQPRGPRGLGVFTFRSRSNRRIMKARFLSRNFDPVEQIFRRDATLWYAIIGTWTRPSAIVRYPLYTDTNLGELLQDTDAPQELE